MKMVSARSFQKEIDSKSYTPTHWLATMFAYRRQPWWVIGCFCEPKRISTASRIDSPRLVIVVVLAIELVTFVSLSNQEGYEVEHLFLGEFG